MRALFLIPKSHPPILEGNFSSEFKDFVNCCLHKASQERSSANELLEHPFIKMAQDLHVLKEWITKFKALKKAVSEEEGSSDEEQLEWDFPKPQAKPQSLPLAKPSALHLVIYPVLVKLLKCYQNVDLTFTRACSSLKISFDLVEECQNGFAHSWIKQVINILKGAQTTDKPSVLTHVIGPALSQQKCTSPSKQKAFRAYVTRLFLAFEQLEKQKPGIAKIFLEELILILKRR